ncbi:unnamed protein product [Urochloa decumbens]|uniref:Uncharacterized protein n=1 Tax=Urochloa decumbens TaxID=240449 RepID=A0ABC9BYG4_9POAL
MDKPLNISRPHLRGWRKTSAYWNAVRRFFSNTPAKAHDDDEQKDLERNIMPVRQPPDRALLVNPIKHIISQLVRAAKQAVDETPQDELQEQQKRCSKYSQKALMFAITTFMAYLGSSSASSPSNGNTAFKIAMAAFFVAIPIDLISITKTPKWGYALVYLSCFLMVLLSYLLLMSFHKDYSCAIIPVLLLFFAALLHRKLRPSARQQNTTNTIPDEHLDSDKVDQDLENIFDWSAGVVNCGGLISMILGHYMYIAGPNHLTEVRVIGFLFFFTVVMGLYLMMVTTVRNPDLTFYVVYLCYLRDALLVGTLIASVIHGVWFSRNHSHV